MNELNDKETADLINADNKARLFYAKQAELRTDFFMLILLSCVGSCAVLYMVLYLLGVM